MRVVESRFCEHGNETPSLAKGEEVLKYLSDYYSELDSAP